MSSGLESLETIIHLQDVCLWRRTQEELSYDLKKTVLSILEGNYRKPRKRLVLDRVNLSITRGEKIGIIGANGSGKSTLLKVICGILEPTQGAVKVKGTIAPLIELGAGFDDDLSVIDNVILYGILMGFPKTIMKQKMQQILDFAELTDYAYVPVKGLSSGMSARLGFAIATDVNPDILIIDEVLSVGDEHFHRKSQQRMNELWHENSTVIVVSHNLKFITEACQKAIVIEHGKVLFFGSAQEAADRYLSQVGVEYSAERSLYSQFDRVMLSPPSVSHPDSVD
ncbi:MAG: ABC transporter ATP-binding protein [Prochlorotrichaceae cyanobacterium]